MDGLPVPRDRTHGHMSPRDRAGSTDATKLETTNVANSRAGLEGQNHDGRNQGHSKRRYSRPEVELSSQTMVDVCQQKYQQESEINKTIIL